MHITTYIIGHKGISVECTEGVHIIQSPAYPQAQAISSYREMMYLLYRTIILQASLSVCAVMKS